MDYYIKNGKEGKVNKDINSNFRKKLYKVGDKVMYLNKKAKILAINKSFDNLGSYYTYDINYKIKGIKTGFFVRCVNYCDLKPRYYNINN